tara:strand:- start:230 stop:499 length:270 start_codon:yes stop_codon:yes gene_type:complete
MSNTLTKKRRLINTLVAGNSITAGEAKSRYNIANIRAAMSDIKNQFEEYGNWQVNTETTSTGKTRYSMDDIHPGERVWGYGNDGTRFML